MSASSSLSILPDAAPARGGAEHSGVNGDDAGEAQGFVAHEDDLLVRVEVRIGLGIEGGIMRSARPAAARAHSASGGEPNDENAVMIAS